MTVVESFTKTDTYGLFKPAHGSSDWGHYIVLNADMVDRLLAVQSDRIARLEADNQRLQERLAALWEIVERMSGGESEK